MTPIISVIIPNYNHARYLEARLRSVLDQTFRDIEIIILDDASTDNSLEVLKSFQSDNRTQLHANKENSGSPFVQWDKGAGLAKGEFIWIAESDDCADTAFLATLVSRLTSNPTAVLAYCNSWIVDKDDFVMGSVNRFYARIPGGSRWRNDYFNNGRSECAEYLSVMNTIPNASAVLFRRAAYLDAGGAKSEYRLCGDWDFWVRMLLRGDVVYVSQHLNRFRRHPKTVRASSEANGLYVKESYAVISTIVRETRLPPERRTRSFRTLASLWVNKALQEGATSAWIADLLPRALEVDPQVRRRLFAYLVRYAIAALLGMRKLRIGQMIALIVRLVSPLPRAKAANR